MRRFHVVAYVVALVVMLLIDAVWLTVMGGLLYRPLLGSILRAEPDFVAAALFYLIYVVGIVAFAVEAGRRGGGWRAAARMGALFGFTAYATYDLTNQATLAAWSPVLTLVDLVWGTALTAVVAAAAFVAAGAATGLIRAAPSRSR